MKTTPITATAVALALIGSLAACTSNAPAPSASSTVPVTTDTTSPEPSDTASTSAPAPAAAPVAGDTITDAALLAACDPAKLPLGIIDYGTGAGQCTLPKTQRVYMQADGTGVLVDKDQPLPAPVLQEVAGEVGAAVPVDNVENQDVVLDSAGKALSAATTATGMTTAAIIQMLGAPCGSDAVNIPVYVAVGAGGNFLHGHNCGAFATPDEALADAQAILGAAGPTGWVVLPYAG